MIYKMALEKGNKVVKVYETLHESSSSICSAAAASNSPSVRTELTVALAKCPVVTCGAAE